MLISFAASGIHGLPLNVGWPFGKIALPSLIVSQLGHGKRGVFHHRVRSLQEYREKWTYMMENPVRKGLVTQWEDWAWRGRVHDFSW